MNIQSGSAAMAAQVFDSTMGNPPGQAFRKWLYSLEVTASAIGTIRLTFRWATATGLLSRVTDFALTTTGMKVSDQLVMNLPADVEATVEIGLIGLLGTPSWILCLEQV